MKIVYINTVRSFDTIFAFCGSIVHKKMKFLLLFLTVLAIWPLSTEACGRMTAAKKKKCLHDQTMISLPDGVIKKAGDLKIGDKVLAFSEENGIHISRVKEIRNSERNSQREFVEFTVVSGRKVTVTLEHGMMVRECGSKKSWTLMKASDVSTQMCVPTLGADQVTEEPINDKKLFKGIGIVQPITDSGTILADGIAVSCYDQEKLFSVNFQYFNSFLIFAFGVLFYYLKF